MKENSKTSKNTYPFVTIVVIGRNESDNLDATFKAIYNMDYPLSRLEVLYVDTNSSDQSVEVARKYTPRVFEEHSSWPSSGLARNRGVMESNYDIVHFVDGDIAIDPNYLKKAVKKIVQPEVDAVTGYFEERDTHSFFNRIMTIRRDEINYTEHYCDATNGGGTYLKAALEEVNGYDERILKGQESELGYRFRQAGYKILFIDAVQGTHNFDLNGPGDFFKSKYVYGKSFGFLLKQKNDLNPMIQSLKKTATKMLISNTTSLSLILLGLITGLYWIIPLYYFMRISYFYISNKILKKRTSRQLAYSFIQYLFSVAVFLGILSVLLNPRHQNVKKQSLKVSAVW